MAKNKELDRAQLPGTSELSTELFTTQASVVNKESVTVKDGQSANGKKIEDVSIPNWSDVTATAYRQAALKKLEQPTQTVLVRKELCRAADEIIRWSSRIAEGFMEPPIIKRLGLDTLDQLGLPHYCKKVSSVDEILDSSAIDSFLPPSPSGKYYVNISKPTGQRFFKFNLTEDKVRGFISQVVKQEELTGTSLVTISEFLPNTYGANIVIHENGHLKVELVEGDHAGLAYYDKHPQLAIDTDPFLGTSKVSHCEFDESTRALCLNLIRRAVGMIPQDYRSQQPDLRFQQDQANTRHPGYYEVIFSLVEVDGQERYIIKFLDYRLVKNYATELEF